MKRWSAPRVAALSVTVACVLAVAIYFSSAAPAELGSSGVPDSASCRHNSDTTTSGVVEAGSWKFKNKESVLRRPLSPNSRRSRWCVCVSVDNADVQHITTVRSAVRALAVPTELVLSLRDATTEDFGSDLRTITSSKEIGVSAAFSACVNHVLSSGKNAVRDTNQASTFSTSSVGFPFAGVVFCEGRSCGGKDLQTVLASAQLQSASLGVVMNERHTVFAATMAAVRAVGLFDSNLHPAIDGLAVDYAVRAMLSSSLFMTPSMVGDKTTSAMGTRLREQELLELNAKVISQIRAAAHRPNATSIHDLLKNTGQYASALSVTDRRRRARCGSSNVLGAKYFSNGTALVTASDLSSLIRASSSDADPQFHRCIMSDGDTDDPAHVRFRLCGKQRHCIFSAGRGLVAVEKQLHMTGNFPSVSTPQRALRSKWHERVTARLAFLLALARDQPWREDIVPAAVLPMMVRDAAFFEDAVMTYDAPIRVFTVLLNTKDDRLNNDLHSIWSALKEKGLGRQFHYFYEPEGVGVSGAWNRQIQHVLQHDPSAQWVWVTQPDVFARPSYLGCFAKDTTSVQFTHSYTRLHVHASIGVTRHFIDQAGYFDENIFPAYGEDIELRMRVRATGIPSWYWQKDHPADATAHVSSVTFKTDSAFAHQATVLWRRQAYLYKKWGALISIESENDTPTEQFMHPFNSRIIPVKNSWNLFDARHRKCIRTGSGPQYANCGGGCFFNLSVVEDHFPNALRKENQDPIRHKLPFPPPSDPQNRQCA